MVFLGFTGFHWVVPGSFFFFFFEYIGNRRRVSRKLMSYFRECPAGAGERADAPGGAAGRTSGIAGIGFFLVRRVPTSQRRRRNNKKNRYTHGKKKRVGLGRAPEWACPAVRCSCGLTGLQICFPNPPPPYPLSRFHSFFFPFFLGCY